MSPKCPKCGKKMWRQGTTPAGKQRWRCGGTRAGDPQCYSTTNPDVPPRKQSGVSKEADKNPVFRRKLRPGTKRFIITAAQNATPIHEEFFASLRAYADAIGAELLVIPYRYKNPTSRWSDSQENAEWWAADLVPYLYNVRARLNKNLVVLGDIKVQPTAGEPLSGFEAITSGESAILGHAKLQLRSIPTPGHKMAKIITTTGACTVSNYSDTKAGKKGDFHHTLGACIVEIDGTKFFLRQLNGNKSSGEFTDLDMTWSPRGGRKAERALAVVLGDVHVGFTDPKVHEATFGKGGIIETLRPRHIVYHDLHDGYACNPHHRGNPFNAIAKVRNNLGDVKAEVERAAKYVVDNTPRDAQAIVVQSNHDDFLRRWIIDTDWRTAPGNAEFYLRTALHMVSETKVNEGGTVYPSPFTYWARQIATKARFMEPGESFSLAGIGLDLHGDQGPNGARGSIRNLRRIGMKTVIGHAHSPGIEEGCYQTGTMTPLSLEYTGPVGSWLNAHVSVQADGKRQLLIIVGGEWRARR